MCCIHSNQFWCAENSLAKSSFTWKKAVPFQRKNVAYYAANLCGKVQLARAISASPADGVFFSSISAFHLCFRSVFSQIFFVRSVLFCFVLFCSFSVLALNKIIFRFIFNTEMSMSHSTQWIVIQWRNHCPLNMMDELYTPVVVNLSAKTQRCECKTDSK